MKELIEKLIDGLIESPGTVDKLPLDPDLRNFLSNVKDPVLVHWADAVLSRGFISREEVERCIALGFSNSMEESSS